MVIGQIDDWCDDVLLYWTGIINGTDYPNKEEMITQLEGFIDNFNSNVKSAYIESDYNLQNFKNILISLYAYVTMKYYVITNPPKEIGNLPITNNDIRTLFSYYNYELPSDYIGLFQLIDVEEGDPLTDGEVTNTGLAALELTIVGDEMMQIDGLVVADEEVLLTIEPEVQAMVNDKVLFMLYKQPEPEIVNDDEFSVVRFILDDMKLWALMQDFNWEIDGVSWNPEWGEFNA